MWIVKKKKKSEKKEKNRKRKPEKEKKEIYEEHNESVRNKVSLKVVCSEVYGDEIGKSDLLSWYGFWLIPKFPDFSTTWPKKYSTYCSLPWPHYNPIKTS